MKAECIERGEAPTQGQTEEAATLNRGIVEELFILCRVVMFRMEKQYISQAARTFTSEDRDTLNKAKLILGSVDAAALEILNRESAAKKTS